MKQQQELAFPPPATLKKLPPNGILGATTLELTALKEIAPEPLKPGPILWGLTRIWLGQTFFLAGPVLGAPMAVMVLEQLRRRQATRLIFTGLAGSLVPELTPGNLFCPTHGLSTEGTSSHYPAALCPNPELKDTIVRLGQPLTGTIWTTDAIYRETMELVKDMRNQGALAVDMETTALMAAANFRGLAMASLLIISDCFSKDHWHNGLKEPAFKIGLKKAAEITWQAIND